MARFIDTLKIFALLNSPIHYIFCRRKIVELCDIFLQGYGNGVDINHLNTARKLHQMEHVCMKQDKGQVINASILKILYKIKV